MTQNVCQWTFIECLTHYNNRVSDGGTRSKGSSKKIDHDRDISRTLLNALTIKSLLTIIPLANHPPGSTCTKKCSKSPTECPTNECSTKGANNHECLISKFPYSTISLVEFHSHHRAQSLVYNFGEVDVSGEKRKCRTDKDHNNFSTLNAMAFVHQMPKHVRPTPKVSAIQPIGFSTSQVSGSAPIK